MSHISPVDLCHLVQNVIDEHKGQDVVTIDLKGKTSIADFLIIASGTSKRHVHALADYVGEAAKKQKADLLSVEGESDSEWVLIDLATVIVHIFTATARTFYDIEAIWNVSFPDKIEPIKKAED